MEHIQLHVGQEMVLTLPGRGTAGYTWTYETAGDTAALSVDSRSRAASRATIDAEERKPTGDRHAARPDEWSRGASSPLWAVLGMRPPKPRKCVSMTSS